MVIFRSRQALAFPNLTGVRVLVVDDDGDAQTILGAFLAYCGAQVTVAGSAREALRLFRRERPRIVVTDIAMPAHDGFWLLRELRRLAGGGASQPSVIAVSAFEDRRAEALAAGFSEYLSKPLDPTAVCRLVRELGESATVSHPPSRAAS